MSRVDAQVAVDLMLPPEATSAGEARRLLRDALSGRRVEDSMDAAQVAVSEIVTNALVHAGTPMHLRVLLGTARTPRGARRRQPAPPPSARLLRGRVDRTRPARGRRDRRQLGRLPVRRRQGRLVRDRRRRGASPPATAEAPDPANAAAAGAIEVELLNVPLLMHAAWQEHAAALLRELLLIRLDEDDDAIESHAAASDALSVLFEQIPAPDLGDHPEAIMAAATEPGVSRTRHHAPGPRIVDACTSRCSTPRSWRPSRWRRRPAAVAADPAGAPGPAALAVRADPRPDATGAPAWPGCPRPTPSRPRLRATLVLGPGRRQPLATRAARRRRRQPDRRGQPVGARAARVRRGRRPGRQRLISIIPLRYHQAHIAGFTLHLVNGRSPLHRQPGDGAGRPRRRLGDRHGRADRVGRPTAAAGGSSPPSSSTETQPSDRLSSSSASNGSRSPTQSSAQKPRSRPTPPSSTPRARPARPPGRPGPGSAPTAG